VIEADRVRQLPLAVGFDAQPDFDEYVTGPNGEAVAALTGWAGGGGEPFVYLFGPAGTGKSHLLLAACRYGAARAASFVYTPLGERHLEPIMLEGLARTDLVALDDLQAVAGDRAWELAVFNLYNELRENGRRLLVSADAPVAALPLELPDLRSRLTWGPGYRLQPLGESDCERLLVRSAKRRGLRLEDDLTRYIMRRCRREPRSLIGLLERLDEASLSRKRRPTLTLVRELLRAPTP
jgi:DnaA family protein